MTDLLAKFLQEYHDRMTAAYPPRRTRHHDPKCSDLAETFLGDFVGNLPQSKRVSDAEFDRLRGELAQHIQDAVEDWLAMEFDGRETSL